MAIDLITGHQGVAHISAEQIANINNALMDDYGVDKVVRLDDGTLTQDGLTINVGTGFWRVNGFDMEIQEAETVYIDPTATGLSRIDNIYVEILQDIPTGSQRSEIVTVQGEAAASPVAPDAPTAPVLNTDILLQVTPLATVTVTEGAMVMTDLSVAYEMVTPQELAAVQTIAENAQTTANTANTSANNALGMIKDSSDAYSSSKAYAVGEHCIYNNVLYKCITACSAAAWSVNQNCFEATTLTDEVSTLKDALASKITTPNHTNFNMYFPNNWNNIFFTHITKTIGTIPANGDGETAITFTIPNISREQLPRLFVTPYSTNGIWCYCTTMVSDLTQTSAKIHVHNMEKSAHSITVAIFIVF